VTAPNPNLNRQVTISCLINLISDLPPEQRNIPLSAIADRTKLNIGAGGLLVSRLPHARLPHARPGWRLAARAAGPRAFWPARRRATCLLSLRSLAPTAPLPSPFPSPPDGVEFLLMKALSLHLIEGSIDQVDGTAAISWVQSRVLTKPQVAGLKERLDTWVSKVNAVGSTLKQESIGVAEV
jgi:hypothetical protein